LKAPAIMHYVSWMKRLYYHHTDYIIAYDEATYPLLDKLFELVRQIEPASQNGVRILWLCADRGTIDDYGNYEEMLDCGEISNREEFEKLWQLDFPEEKEWFHFGALEDQESGYRCIHMNHRLIIETFPDHKPDSHPYNISELVEWLVDAVQGVINDLEKDTYNARVQQQLPIQHRTGTIRRKDFWDVYPSAREDFFKDITQDEVDRFVAYMINQSEEVRFTNGISTMTASDFYRYCALGYKANNYDGCELSPKEQYYKHADGRDEGLKYINVDSPEAFAQWYHDPKRGGGHPFEVCRGGNSTHVSLYVHNKSDGWYLSVAGDAWNRTIEAVKFYLALRQDGLPVYMHNGQMLAERLLQNEKIGIVPEGVFPAYCEKYFPDEQVIDFMNLDYGDRDLLASFCTWQKIPQVKLMASEECSYEV